MHRPATGGTNPIALHAFTSTVRDTEHPPARPFWPAELEVVTTRHVQSHPVLTIQVIIRQFACLTSWHPRLDSSSMSTHHEDLTAATAEAASALRLAVDAAKQGDVRAYDEALMRHTRALRRAQEIRNRIRMEGRGHTADDH